MNTITQKREINKMNVKPKFLKVMKQRIFTLVMMLALVIVTGSAFAVNETTVVGAGTYTYNLSGVSSINAITISVDYTGSNETITELNESFALPALSVDSVVSFTVKYGTVGSPSSSGNIEVTVSDATSGCSNSIKLAITVTAVPTIDLTMTATQDQYCQTTLTTTNNVAASSASANTLTFTVTKSVTNAPGTYTWAYTIAIPNDGLSSYVVKRNGVVTAPGAFSGIASGQAEVWTVEFETTTNLAAKSITATLSAASLTEVGGGGANYAETGANPNSDTVTVKSMPAIGSFL